MSKRPFTLNKTTEYTLVEYLENVGWSQLFLPVYPQAGDIMEVESELCFTNLTERQAELSNVDPRLHWGVYDSNSFYCGIGDTYTTNCGLADMDWHVFRIVSGGADAGFWLDGVRTYELNPMVGKYASTGLQLWRNLSSSRRCLNKKKWLRVLINGEVVMQLIPVLDAAGEPALYDTVNRCFYYNSGADALVAGPVVSSSAGIRRVEYAEGLGMQYCFIPIAVDGSDGRPFTCVTDIQFTGTTRELMGISTNACCYWGATADKKAYELGGGSLLAETAEARNTITYTRSRSTAKLECNGQQITRSTPDAPGHFNAYGILKTAQNHIATDVCQARIYEVWMYENEDLTHHLLPVLDDLGVCCLYDSISGECFYSDGEVPFVAGPLLQS